MTQKWPDSWLHWDCAEAINNTMSEQQQRCEKFQFWQNLHSGMNRPLGPSHHQSATTLRALLSTSSSPFSPSMSSSLSSALIVIRNAYIVICHICKWLIYHIDHFFILITLIQISITRRGKSCGKAVLLHQNQLETTIIIVVWQTHPLSHSFFLCARWFWPIFLTTQQKVR